MASPATPQGKLLLEAAFQEFFSTGIFPVERCMDPEFQQWSDGEELDYDAFTQHMQALGKRMKQGYSFDSFIVDQTITEGNTFVSRHRVQGKTPEGLPFTVFVLAIFEIRNGKFIRCWELSHTEGGSKVDQSLASTLE